MKKDMTQEELELDDGVFLTAGWLEDLYNEIDELERTVSMNGYWSQHQAEGMRKALEIIKDHI